MIEDKAITILCSLFKLIFFTKTSFLKLNILNKRINYIKLKIL